MIKRQKIFFQILFTLIDPLREIVIIAILPTILLIAVPVKAAEKFDWMPDEAVGANLTARNQENKQIDQPVIFTKIPKATADASKFTKEYLIDLAKFNISNKGSNPIETSKGINSALQHAKAEGANRIIFPKGIYLISESDPVILDHKNTIIDLNGATLQINTNGLDSYGIVTIVDEAENLRLTNGTLRGDRDTHDYETKKTSHEWGCGIVFKGGCNLEVDNITVTNVPGYGVLTGSATEANRYKAVFSKNLEKGGFSDSGEKVENDNKTRSINPYDISKPSDYPPKFMLDKEFEFGYTLGYSGYPHIKDREYQAYFYSEPDGKGFISKIDCCQFIKVIIPKNAKFLHLEFNQPAVNTPYCGWISDFRPPRDVHFHDNHIYDNRALGMGICGGQKWIIENNLIEGNGGKAPGYGIDFEDGWELMQNFVLRNNKFKGNKKGDLVVCAGIGYILEGNEFEKDITVWDRTENYTFMKNRIVGTRITFGSKTGNLIIHDNYYENAQINVRYGNQWNPEIRGLELPPVEFSNETVVNCSITSDWGVRGTALKFRNCQIKNSRFSAGKDTSLVHLANCILTDTSISYEVQGPEVNVLVENCKGTLSENGNIKRKVARQYVDEKIKRSAEEKKNK